MDACVFIQTNHKQWLGALIAQYAIRRHSSHNDKFAVRILHAQDAPFLHAREGQLYLRDRAKRLWQQDDLQSFTPLRFLPPELMGYAGRAVVIDPDIFAVGDMYELLRRDMAGKALMCRERPNDKGFASSVMLLDCAKLMHWRCEEQFDELFAFRRDYSHWITLKYEPRETIGMLEDVWNDFDRLTPHTKLLHNTRRRTQPWKTGLPVDFKPSEHMRLWPPKGWIKRAKRMLFGEYAFAGYYQPHPDLNQERFFFGLLRECLDQGVVTEDVIRREMQHNHLRHDAFEVLEQTPLLARA